MASRSSEYFSHSFLCFCCSSISLQSSLWGRRWGRMSSKCTGLFQQFRFFLQWMKDSRSIFLSRHYNSQAASTLALEYDGVNGREDDPVIRPFKVVAELIRLAVSSGWRSVRVGLINPLNNAWNVGRRVMVSIRWKRRCAASGRRKMSGGDELSWFPSDPVYHIWHFTLDFYFNRTSTKRRYLICTIYKHRFNSNTLKTFMLDRLYNDKKVTRARIALQWSWNVRWSIARRICWWFGQTIAWDLHGATVWTRRREICWGIAWAGWWRWRVTVIWRWSRSTIAALAYHITLISSNVYVVATASIIQ